MAYLTKEQYERRRENAAQRNADNEEILISNGMTEEQAEAISRLCVARHNFHKDIKRLVYSYESADIAELTDAALQIVESGLKAVPGVPTDAFDCDIDSIEVLKDLAIEGIEEIPDEDEDPEAYQGWYDDTHYRIYNEWENINETIEAYLRDIDKQYGSHTAPTGVQRLF